MKRLEKQQYIKNSSLFIGILLLLNQPVFAQEKTLVIGVEDIANYPSYDYSYRTRTYSGYLRELMDHFGQDYHYRMIYRPLPVKRLYYELTSGQIDLKIPDNPEWNPQFTQGYKIHYSAPLQHYTEGFMTWPNQQITQVNQLKNIVYIRGFSLPDLGDNHIDEFGTSQLKDALSMMLSHKADAIFLNITAGRWMLSSQFHQADALVFNKHLPYVESNYLASTLNNTTALKKLNTFLAENQDLVHYLKAKYGISKGFGE